MPYEIYTGIECCLSTLGTDFSWYRYIKQVVHQMSGLSLWFLTALIALNLGTYAAKLAYCI